MKPRRYKAFISYAHADEAFAAALHERLERFVVPSQLRSSSTGRRLGRLFRDRDELASGGSLPERILDALADSEHLIVVCSTASARSSWVNREIDLFLADRSLDDVLLVVPDTVPAGDIPIPEAIARRGELVAADARLLADGPRRATLKLIAGLLGVPFDTLVQRDRFRRRRQWSAIGAGLALLAIIGIVGVHRVTMTAREAEARRQQAAAFVGPFVDNLAQRIDRYEKVGALDEDLEKALDFFATLPPDEIDPTSLRHYRTALVGIGSVRIRQGKPREALDVYQRALELSQSMVDRDDRDASRWHDLAMHTYYIGEARWEMQEFAAAAERIVESLRYAERAAELAPDNFEYQIEVVYGLNNVGAVETRANDFDAATAALERSLERIGALRTRHPDRESELLQQEVEAVSWLAEITQKRSDYDAAFGWHERELDLRRKLIESSDDNPLHIGRLSDALGYYAQTLLATGRTDKAVAVLNERMALARQLTAADPENAFFRERLLLGEAMLANALFDAGEPAAATAALDSAERGMREMVQADLQATAVRRDLTFVASSRAYMLLRKDPAHALKLASAALAGMAEEVAGRDIDPLILAQYLRCAEVLAAAERLHGVPGTQKVSDALRIAESHGNPESSNDVASRVILLRALGRYDAARPLETRLESLGYRPIYYRTMLEILAAPEQAVQR